uniref:Brinker DNA-binding domain-containing protein n=1 Tax=Ditylenchus dipsaci TaxID=166011 RepID=A0A915DWS7_9BILA
MSDFEQIDLDGNAKKLKFYTIEKKLEVVAFAKKAKSINSASKRHNVDRKCVRKWMEHQIGDMEVSSKTVVVTKMESAKVKYLKNGLNKKLRSQLTELTNWKVA